VIDHATNTPLAYTFGTLEHKYLDKLLALLSPFNIGTVYSDDNYSYHDKILAEKLVTGKKNTQQIEINHLTLWTRIKRLCRKTICFSKDKDIHKAVIGTFINTYFFERNICISIRLWHNRESSVKIILSIRYLFGSIVGLRASTVSFKIKDRMLVSAMVASHSAICSEIEKIAWHCNAAVI
jgi:insertion element IS1 protein InsB